MKKAYLNTSLLSLFALIFLIPTASSAQSAAEIRAQIEAQNAQIEALNKEIAGYEKELTAVGAQKQTLQTTVAQLDLSRKKITANINVTKNKISTLQLELQNLAKDIQRAEGSIGVNEAGLAESIRRVNEAETKSMVLAMLSSASIATLWNDVDQVRELQDAMNTEIQDLSAQKTSLTETKNATERKQAELVTQQKNLTSQQNSLDVTRRAQAELLAQTKSKESNYQALLAEKVAAKAAFERSLDELESKLQFTLDPSRVPPAGKGILRWPLDNVYVTQKFGRTGDSGRLYVSGTHNGIDFRASIGTPVKAALSGTVVGTGNTDLIRGCYSYGKWVLIKHGNGLTTIYAHLSEIKVSQGSTVSTGEVIGYSGFTGYATGPHLHFGLYASDAVSVQQLSSGKGCDKAVIPVSAASGYMDPMDYL